MSDWLKKSERKQKPFLPVKSMPFHQVATQCAARLSRTCFASAPGMALIEMLVALVVTVVLLVVFMQRGHQFPLVEFPYPVSTVSQVLNDRDRAKRFSRLRAMVAGAWFFP